MYIRLVLNCRESHNQNLTMIFRIYIKKISSGRLSVKILHLARYLTPSKSLSVRIHSMYIFIFTLCMYALTEFSSSWVEHIVVRPYPILKGTKIASKDDKNENISKAMCKNTRCKLRNGKKSCVCRSVAWCTLTLLDHVNTPLGLSRNDVNSRKTKWGVVDTECCVVIAKRIRRCHAPGWRGHDETEGYLRAGRVWRAW